MGRAHGAQCLEMSKEWTHVGGRGGGGVDAVVGGSPVATFKSSFKPFFKTLS